MVVLVVMELSVSEMEEIVENQGGCDSAISIPRTLRVPWSLANGLGHVNGPQKRFQELSGIDFGGLAKFPS